MGWRQPFFCGLILSAVIALPPESARADSIDEQVAEAKAHLKKNPMNLPSVVVEDRQAALAMCTKGPVDPSKSPDRQNFASKLTGPKTKAKSVYDILHHEGGKTDRQANDGIKNWMRDSVISDCRLYRAARIFLGRLQEEDLKAGLPAKEKLLVPIEDKATVDVLKLAREAARAAFDGTRDDNYLAQKVLALYGHDNMNNELASSVRGLPSRCELAVLDAYKPESYSNLYRNGAIPGLSYAAEDIASGKKIAQECKAACSALVAQPGSYPGTCWGHCNDSHDNYQADYYHVVASSYLVCFAELNSRRGSEVLGMALGPVAAANAAADKTFDVGYPAVAGQYKKERFAEESAFVDHLGDGKTPPPWGLVVKKGLELLPASVNAAQLCTDLKLTCSPADVRAAQAILDRQSFEVKFREKQHRLGQEFARQECAPGKASLDHPMCDVK